jgi:hypothetical protein
MKKMWVLLMAGFLLACVCPSIPIFTPDSSPDNPGPVNPITTTEPVIPDKQVSSGRHTVVRLHPEDGNLSTQLRGEARQAAALGQHMFVEFDASW